MRDSINSLKKQLADAIRMLEMLQHLDFNGHFSVRTPDQNRIFINSAQASRSRVTEDDILILDMEGNVLDGNGRPPNEYPLHTQIYKKRKDILSVCHTHPKWSTLFTIAQIPLRPVVMQGGVLGSIPVFPKTQSISDKAIAEELAENLGEHSIILLKAHGAVLTGQNIMETFVRSVFLEENAQKQYLASQIGCAHSLQEEEIKTMAPFLWRNSNIQKVWDYYRSKLRDGRQRRE